VERKVQLLEKGGRGHPEHFLPKAEVPRLSESVQRLYKQNSSNADRSFQLKKHFVRAPRTTTTKDC
jgi:hypothetical protein